MISSNGDSRGTGAILARGADRNHAVVVPSSNDIRGSSHSTISWIARFASLFAAFLFAVTGALPLSADDPLPTDDEKPAAKPSGKPVPPDDDKLIRQLNPAAKFQIEEEIARLERAIEGMRQANKRIEGSDAGAETRAVQKRVIDDLETLLANLQKEINRRKNLPEAKEGSAERRQGRQSTSKSQLDPQNSGQREQPRNQNRTQSSQRNDDEKSRDAQERLEAAKAAQADESRRQQMIKDVWGHLPPHLREAMRNTFSEKYLPKYEDLVKRYYEALAEKNRKRQEN